MTITRTLISSQSLFLLLLLLALSAVPAAHAQQSNIPAYGPTGIGVTNSNGNVSIDSSPLANSMREKMAVERNDLRQQKIISDTAQLLALAQKLNAEVAKSNKDMLSVSIVKEAGEIQKLAKSIKDKMRNGY